MINNCVLMGRLVADPARRLSPTGIPVSTFTIACQRDFADKSKEKAVDFIDVVAWRHTADFVSKYMTKGRMAVVSGRLQLNDWTDRDGNKRRSAEIVANSVHFGDSRPQNQAVPAPAYPDASAATPDNGVSAGAAAQGGPWAEIDGSDSDLPF